MELLRRKIDQYLRDWHADPDRKPLIVRGARQVGKTESVRYFGRTNYESFIEINFILQKSFDDIFDDGYDVDTIIKNISFHDTSLRFIPGQTLIFFDEIQKCPNAATSLKAFRQDGRFDVICSGSLMGVNYEEIESNSVGNKTDYDMYSMDFEEFLWASGYSEEQIGDMYDHMITLRPLTASVMNVMQGHFRDYMILGGMPEVVARFVRQGNFNGTLELQRQILRDYEEDITKYAQGLDKAKILNVYRSIPAFLSKENRKFQITKVAKGARSREYIGVIDWLDKAGIVNICYCLNSPDLPLKGNYDADNFRLYMSDTGLLTASLDEEVQEDLRQNVHLGTYKGALFENAVGEMLKKQGYQLFFFKNRQATLEMEFFTRDAASLIPVEVKAGNGPAASLNHLIARETYPDIHYGIKLAANNVGFNGTIYTFPYFLGFMLKRFLKERK